MKGKNSPAPHRGARSEHESGTDAAAPTTRSSTATGAEVVRPQPREEHGFEIRDAIKVYDAAVAHETSLFGHGLTPADLATLQQDIAAAIEHEGGVGRVSLDKSRQNAKNLVGDYRTAAELSCSTTRGPVPGLAATLRVDVPFPDGDAALAKYVSAILGPMKTHSVALAARGFSAVKQKELVDAGAQFGKALETRPAERSKLEVQGAARKRAFGNLKLSTQFVRRTGRAALKGSPSRADFDRVDSRAASDASLAARAAARLEKARTHATRAQTEAAAAQAEVQKLEAELQATTARVAVEKGKRGQKGGPKKSA